jgi:uncharacterized damage-inducible protein DinB
MTVKDTLLAEYDHEMGTTRRLLERIPDDKLAWKPHEKSRALGELACHLGNIPTWMFSMPRVAAFRSFVLNHTIHHRGQLSVYLRLNQIPVPPIYGPTADEG